MQNLDNIVGFFAIDIFINSIYHIFTYAYLIIKEEEKKKGRRRLKYFKHKSAFKVHAT